MGYDTQFMIQVLRHLATEPPIGDMTGAEDVAAALNGVVGGDVFSVYQRSELMLISRLDSQLLAEPVLACSGITWYDREDDLDRVSTLFPTLELWVVGLGDDALFGDVWCQVFLNGRHTPKLYRWNMLWSMDQSEMQRLRR